MEQRCRELRIGAFELVEGQKLQSVRDSTPIVVDINR